MVAAGVGAARRDEGLSRLGAFAGGGAVTLVGLVLLAVVVGETMPSWLAAGGFAVFMAVVYGIYYGDIWHRSSRAAAIPGTAWAGSVLASVDQLAALGAPVYANGWGSYGLTVNGGNLKGVVRITSDSIIWESTGDKVNGYRGTTMVVPLSDVGAIVFGRRGVRAMQTLNMRVVTPLGLADFAILWHSRDVRGALRGIGYGHLIQG